LELLGENIKHLNITRIYLIVKPV